MLGQEPTIMPAKAGYIGARGSYVPTRPAVHTAVTGEDGYLVRQGDLQHPPPRTPSALTQLGTTREAKNPDLFLLPEPERWVPGTRNIVPKRTGIQMKPAKQFLDYEEPVYDGPGGGKGNQKLREAESINLPDLPHPHAFKRWKNEVRHTVSTCSDKPMRALAWLTSIESAASWEDIKVDLDFYSMEIRLSKSVIALFNSPSVQDQTVKLIQRDLKLNFALQVELYQSHDKILLGRQLLKMVYGTYAISIPHAKQLDADALRSARYDGSDLMKFQHKWKRMAANLNFAPD